MTVQASHVPTAEKVIGRTIVALMVFIGILLLVCCGHTPISAAAAGGYEALNYAKHNTDTYLEAHPELTPEIRRGIIGGVWVLGMTQDDVRQGLGFIPNHKAVIGGNIVWFWGAGNHRFTFTFSGHHGRLLEVDVG